MFFYNLAFNIRLQTVDEHSDSHMNETCEPRKAKLLLGAIEELRRLLRLFGKSLG